MSCLDPLTLALLLARYLLWVLSGTEEVAVIWQGLRTVATVCSEGPLG